MGEHFFEGYFLEKGAFIAKPTNDFHRIDYVVEWHGQLVRVNVKTLYLNKKSYKCHTMTRGGEGKKRKYFPGEIDYFGVVSLEYKRIWMVPLETVQGCELRWHQPDKPHKRQWNSFNWDHYLITDTASSLQLDIDSYLMNRVSSTNLVKLS